MDNLPPDLCAAIELGKRGFAVFPIYPNQKMPATANGCCDAAANPDAIRSLWGNRRNLNVGIEAGRSGLVLLDVDNKGERSGERSLALLEKKYGPLPLTLMVATPSGGKHYYFRQESSMAVRNRKDFQPIGIGLEIKTSNQYVVAPPSSIDGQQYQWANDAEIAVCPAWLAALTLHDVPKPPPAAPVIITTYPTQTATPEPKLRRMTPFERAERYTDKAAGVGQGGRNAACFNLAILLNQKFPELTGDEIAMLVGQWNQRNTPPLDESELQTTINSAARYPRPAAAPETASIDARSDAEILEAVLEMNELARASRATVTAANTPAQQSGFTLLSVSDLRTQFPDERAAVIEGLLRKGETMNVIGAAKSRKTWLLLSLMLSVASGRTWMGFSVQKGKVLHIDNELHGTTINKRITKVADGLGLTDQDYADNYRCRPLRGQLLNLTDIANKLTHTIKPGEYSLIVIDALYKALPSYVKDENDNAGMTRAFCELDQLAERFGCAIIVVHHQSKGNQAGKKVTDVGSGAGAQSRSVDTHLIVREHKEPNSVVMEAVARDFAPTPPVVLRWQYPLYTADPNGNPALLKEREIEIPTMPVSVFVDRIVGPKWVSKAVIAAKAIKNGISGREADRLIVEAIEDELLEVRGGSGKTPKEYRANTVNNDAPF